MDSPIAIQRIVRDRYSAIARGRKESIIDAIEKLASFMLVPNASITSIRTEVIKTIHRLFEFQFVALSIKSRNDSRYHYVACIGLTPAAEATYKQIAYTASDLFDDGDFPSTKVGKFTRFYMAEDRPFKDGEEGSYSRPTLLSQVRSSMDDMVEGDYIDVFMYGHINDIVGYIELAGTRTGKLPPRESLKWIEVIGSLLASIELQKECGRT